MRTIKDLTEPAKAFPQVKEAHHQNAIDYFDELVKKSETNVEANKSTCAAYYKKLGEIESSNKALKKKRRHKKFLRFLEILCFITIVLIPVGILIKNKIKNNIDSELKDMDKFIARLTEEANNLKAEAEKQCVRLNASFDWNTCATLVSQTIPLVTMDKVFSKERYQHLCDSYGYKDHDDDVSTVYVQSGAIYGNPFVIEKNLVREIRPFMYTGTLVITYPVRVSNGRGGYTTTMTTQTLTATLSKPKPFYFYDTWLVYGNAAAPSLSFSRTPSGANGMSDKDIEKEARKYEKTLSKMNKKDINFTPMSNTEFENLFHGINRDNEVEYRLLFTPLAQKNELDLIKMKEPYGDDFLFAKRKCLNFIKTKHSQGVDFSSNPSIFMGFDVEKMKANFVSYNDVYMQSFYFDLAPLIAIPLYQNYKDKEYIYRDNHKNRHTAMEVESLANTFDRKLFAHKDTATDVILKSKYVKSEDGSDFVNIVGHSFKGIPHVTMVPILGGDGHMHPVPVSWVEYIPVSKMTPFVVKGTDMGRNEYLSSNNNILAKYGIKNVYYQKGLVGGLVPTSNEKK